MPVFSPKNTFPIVAQLVILALILGGIFGTALLRDEESIANATAVAPLYTNTKTIILPDEITESLPLRAEAAYVWDVAAQRALYSENAHEALPLASITKLMTTLMTHELLAEDTTATVSTGAIKQEGASGLAPGEQLSIDALRRLALVSSSNDAAYEMAASVGTLLGDGEPVDQFVAGMNIRAEELGLETLEFRNTTGLDLSSTQPGAIGSARDISFLMEYIITHYPELLDPTKDTYTRVYNETGEYHDIENTNQIAQQIPNMIGSKTGYTDLAGGNLTIAFDVALDRPIIITVLGSTYDERFSDVMTLVRAIETAFANSEN